MKMEIRAERCREKPKTSPATARALLERFRAFYADPENEQAFREWKAEQERKRA